MSDTFRAEQIRWFRFRRSGLATPFSSAGEACAALAGVQAQIVPAAGLALWNRTREFTHAALEHALYDDRSLLKLWGQRHTLHLYPSAEWPLVHAAVSPRETWWERRVRDRGGDVDAHRATVLRVATLLRERGTLSRDEVRSADLGVAPELLSSWGGIFAELVRRGEACHAKPVGGEGRFAHRTFWLNGLDWELPDSETANIELVRRYLRTYAPATTQDVAYWRGARVGDAARWVKALGAAVTSIRLDGRDAWALVDDMDLLAEKPPSRTAWPTRMLYRFDPYLLAHRDKDWAVDPRFHDRVWRPAGHIEGIVLVHGQAQATWRYERSGDAMEITVAPFAALDRRVVQSIESSATGIGEYFDAPVSRVRIRSTRYRVPLNKASDGKPMVV